MQWWQLILLIPTVGFVVAMIVTLGLAAFTDVPVWSAVALGDLIIAGAFAIDAVISLTRYQLLAAGVWTVAGSYWTWAAHRHCSDRRMDLR